MNLLDGPAELYSDGKHRNHALSDPPPPPPCQAEQQRSIPEGHPFPVAVIPTCHRNVEPVVDSTRLAVGAQCRRISPGPQAPRTGGRGGMKHARSRRPSRSARPCAKARRIEKTSRRTSDRPPEAEFCCPRVGVLGVGGVSELDVGSRPRSRKGVEHRHGHGRRVSQWPEGVFDGGDENSMLRAIHPVLLYLIFPCLGSKEKL